MPSHRRRRETPYVPSIPPFQRVTDGSTASAAWPLLDDAWAGPASWRPASGAKVPVTRPQLILGRAPRCSNS